MIKPFPEHLLQENTLNVHSIFKSIQGEGVHSGRETLFIRLSGCPFRCKYCDEKQSLIPKENNITTFEDILNKIDNFYIIMVVNILSLQVAHLSGSKII